MLKSKLNQYNYIIEGMTTDEREETIQRVQDYYVSQNDDFIALTDDISNNVNTYKALRNDMNEVDDNNFTATVDFENNNKNVVQNAGKYDGSSNLVGIADDGGNINYDPKKHIVEIASPVYKNDTYDHIYIENDVLYAKGLDANTIDNDDSISITLNIYPKKTERNYLYSGNEHPIRDDRYNMSKALNNDTELLIQQNKQIGMLGLITTGILGVGLYVLSRK
jgi:hypothetical protein